jgi:hypothetical protein
VKLPPPLQIVSICVIFIDSLFDLFCFNQFLVYLVNNSVTSTVTKLNKIKNNFITELEALPRLLTTCKISQQNCQNFCDEAVSYLKAKKEPSLSV